PSVTAATGMDALCHAVEAYTNHTYCTKLENRMAKEAVRLIHEYLPRAYENGSDREARQQMQQAAFCAGRAFTRGCVGNVHAAGHTLSALYGVAHGQAMATLLPMVLRMYGSKVHRRLAELAQECGFTGTEAEKAEAFIRWIEVMNTQMGLPSGFAMIRDEDIPQMCRWAMAEANPVYPVPVVWGEKQFRQLFETARQNS
ncbi:MAG: iron-containing alcohol dehydrogenase, partial [Clostridia bacterium]|nr:iron-containing alcohol dehydrogenase [Clostridia bacterium]